MTITKPTWYILGAGALGSLWASYFRQAGFPVVLISKTPRKQNTIVLHNTSGITQLSVKVTTANQLNKPINHLLISTKAQQTDIAIKSIFPHLSDNAIVLALQNGMLSEQLTKTLHSQNLFAAVTTDGAYRQNENTVIHAGIGTTKIGRINDDDNGDGDHTSSKQLLAQLPSNYLNIEYCNNIKQQQWKKLALNCAINGLTVFYQCKNGELLNSKNAHTDLKKLCAETHHILSLLKISIAGDANTLYQDVVAACTNTANNYSSMYQDIKHQRTTEIDFLNGYLCQLAKEKKIPCSENQKIVDFIKNIESTFTKQTSNK